MSNTRRTSGNGPLRQERFASSQEFERGLMANLVAKRCTVLERTEDRELVWFLQSLSHQRGGLKRLAAELCERFAERVATPTMQRLGSKPGQVYSAKQVEQVRAEIPGGDLDFRLRGEIDEIWAITAPDGPRDALDEYTGEWERERNSALESAKARAATQPNGYEASRFVAACRSAAAEYLERRLGELCLDPAAALLDNSPWYFPALVSTLRELYADHVSQCQAAQTAIGKQVFEALDYALASGKLVLIDGQPRRGKSHSAKAWCQQHAGAARYAQVPATNDDFAFFRAIGECLGISINLKSKAQELRGRIEETLQSSKLMLVLDEAHYLWPQSNYRHTTPGRVNWLMTALVNNGVPVALVTTPQFFRSQKEIEERTHWTSEQFTGRIGFYAKLPESLSPADLRLVAKAMLPEGDTRCIESLADYAQGSKKYLGAIESAVPRARYIASRAGRDKVVFADVKQAIMESVIPSDSALAAALAPAEKRRRNVPLNASAPPLQPQFTRLATPEPTPDLRRGVAEVGESNRLADLDGVPG
jgi:hypothetical protein